MSSEPVGRLAVRETQQFEIRLQTRLPFRYGITTMTEVPHLFVRVALEVNGLIQHGIAADCLPPKWFTKNPLTTFEDDLAEMRSVIHHACLAACQVGESATVFELWTRLFDAQRAWAEQRAVPPLLWGFGVSLVERACLDAFCRATGTTFAKALRCNTLGISLGQTHRELEGILPAQFLPAEPFRTLRVRHTVGLGDALTDADISATESVDDALPVSLEACIARYGLTHFKIKLGGNVETDRARLHQLALIIGRATDSFAFTLDGNENYRAVAPFRAWWEELRADATIARFLEKLLFVEQPLHRDTALTDETAEQLHAWPDRPPLIIDESDAEPDSLPRALAAGYVGTSYKSCKGVFHGIANACLIAHRRIEIPGLQISAEDLVNIGPVALLQDLAVVAALGIAHIERNGHHYFRGLQQFPAQVQRQVLHSHGDLYETHPGGFPMLRIARGTIELGSVVDAPFGPRFELDTSIFPPA